MNLSMLCFAAQFFLAQAKAPMTVQASPEQVVAARDYFAKECQDGQAQAAKDAEKAKKSKE